jgi:transposase-like protein
MPTSPATSPFDRPRWSIEDAREVIAALERSGQSVSVFAAEHGLDPQRVYGWRRRVGARAERTTFREVTVPLESSRFEVILGSGARVRVPRDFDGEALVRLLEALAQADVC